MRVGAQKSKYIGIPRHDIICKVCNAGSIENEPHFLLDCTAYRLLRPDYILMHECAYCSMFQEQKCLYSLLNSKNGIVVKLLIKFIIAMLYMRETLLY